MSEAPDVDETIVETRTRKSRNGSPAVTLLESDEDQQPQVNGATAPLFDFGDSSAECAYITVSRTAPVIDGGNGYVGRVPANAEQGDIGRAYGGGKFLCEARLEGGRVMKNGKRFVEIAGAPKFESKIIQRKWERSQLEEEDLPLPAAPAALPPGSAIAEQIALMEARAKLEQQQWQRQLDTMNAANEKQRLENQAADQARKAEAKEREAEREKTQERERERDREHQKSMLAMATAGRGEQGGDMKAMIAGITLATKMMGGQSQQGDGEESDPVIKLIEGIPAIFGAVKEEFRSGARGAAPNPGEVPAEKPQPEGVRLTGELGAKAKTFIAQAKARGINPNAAMEELLERATASIGGTAAKAPAKKAAPAAAKAKAKKKK